MSEAPVFHEMILENQRHWREIERGVLSRPVTFPRASSWVDRKMKQVFEGYVDQSRPSLVITGSALLDETSSPYLSNFHYPAKLNQEDYAAYNDGLTCLNEYMTDFAATYFFTKVAKGTLFNPVARQYSRLFARAIAYETNQNPNTRMTNRLMSTIEKKIGGQAFERAIFDALFVHDRTLIDEAVRPIAGNDCDLDNVAVSIGRINHKKTPSELNAQSTKTEAPVLEDEIPCSSVIEFCRRMKLSVGIGGRVSGPGIAELILTIPSAAALTAFSSALIHGTSLEVSAYLALASGLASGSIWGGVAVHEAVHVYSQDENYQGLFRRDLIRE